MIESRPQRGISDVERCSQRAAVLAAIPLTSGAREFRSRLSCSSGRQRPVCAVQPPGAAAPSPSDDGPGASNGGSNVPDGITITAAARR
jgi:hypothetical protein